MVLRKYWVEVLKNFGVGLMVASVVLLISERVGIEASFVTLLAGLTNVLAGFILLRAGEKDEQ